MKTIGLVGGLTWYSTLDYYRIINEQVNRRLGDDEAAKIILYSVNYGEIKKLTLKGDWDKAMTMLKSRLYEEEMRKREAVKNAANSSKRKIEWGSQIRSYVFHPYKMIKDHRTNFEVGNVAPVMDGELDGFIKAYLMQSKEVES